MSTIVKILFFLSIASLIVMSGCTKEFADQPIPNKLPKTLLWLFPDSSVSEGQSRQRVHWWGEDPDGIVLGFLFTSGKFTEADLKSHATDALSWRWKRTNDTLIAFPLLTKRDTFNIAVRAVDNTINLILPENALIRLVPEGIAPASYSGLPFWDRNENGVYDSIDAYLPTLRGALDPTGAILSMPLLNQPPSVAFAKDPNDPTKGTMVQPETTFTVATFGWSGSDPDGKETIDSYDIALNDSTNTANYFTVSKNDTIVTLLAPRSRTDALHGVQSISADIWTGTFLRTRRFIGSLPNLKLDTLNVFYVRARDIAGDVSKFVRMPSDPTKHWFVKNPRGKLLIISDYLTSDRTDVLNFYKHVFSTPLPLGVGISEFEVLDISRGLNAQDKRDQKVGPFVPPFIDPAFTYTLQLFDIVFWYTDGSPGTGIARSSLFHYLRDPSHRGKVIFSTMFETASDPSGALTDFAPLDSVSSVNLANTHLLPTMGDNTIPRGYFLFPDSSEPGDIFPRLTFGNTYTPALNRNLFSVFLRNIYKRADSRYIYHIQPDARPFTRYTYLATLNDLQSIEVQGNSEWACGSNGCILFSPDRGETWSTQSSGKTEFLRSIRFSDQDSGWAVGEAGAIVRTTDAGQTWTDYSVITNGQDLHNVFFTSSKKGYIVGTNGLFIQTTNAGKGWTSVTSRTTRTLNDVKFLDSLHGIVVGDKGWIFKTSNGGLKWDTIITPTIQNLYAVAYPSLSRAIAVGSEGTILVTTDGGTTWHFASSGVFVDLHSVFSLGANAWIPGDGGVFLSSVNSGDSWILQPTRNGQNLMSTAFTSSTDGIIVGTGGSILTTQNGGLNWTTRPDGHINVGVIDGIGTDGKRSFLFLGLPLHVLDGNGGGSSTVVPFLRHVIYDEFGG